MQAGLSELPSGPDTHLVKVVFVGSSGTGARPCTVTEDASVQANKGLFPPLSPVPPRRQDSAHTPPVQRPV